MDVSALRHVLLDLLAPARTVAPERLAKLGGEAWEDIGAMAAQHRLEPLLHARNRGNPAIPAVLAQAWQTAHRQCAFRSLAQKADLGNTCRLLGDNGFSPIALKGAWLAWHCYPEPAQRPLRDIDLLLTPDTTETAFELLRASGYELGEVPEMAIADLLRLDKHMPVLIAPRGTLVELHHRLSMPDGRMDHSTPEGSEAAIRARAAVTDGIAFPAPEDMLAHLIVHAVYGHRLNCGPLVLSDIALLLAAHSPDWPAFWRRAQDEGWAAGAALLFELVRRYHGDDAAPPVPAHVAPPPPELLESAPDLLLQDLETRQSANFAANALKPGAPGLLRRIAGKHAASDGPEVRRNMTGKGGFFGWAGTRLRQTIGDLAKADVRRQSHNLARLSRWLDHADRAL